MWRAGAILQVRCVGVSLTGVWLLSRGSTHTGSAGEAPGLYSSSDPRAWLLSVVCGIFPDQGLKLCLLALCWQADSLLLSHQGSPDQPPLKLLTFALVSLSLLVGSVCPQPVHVKYILAGYKNDPVQFLSQKDRRISVCSLNALAL